MGANNANNINAYCVSSRVRIARNIKGYPFCDRMNDEQFSEIIDKVRGALGNTFTYINFSSLLAKKKNAYVEQHLVSPEFAGSKHKTALFLNEERNVSVMVGEEDHIRIQAFSKGLDLKGAYSLAEDTESLLEKRLDFLFDERYGYITRCPTNLGTGLRASVMMFLPATVTSSSVSVIASELAKRGMVIRGVYGEGSSSLGSLYQISNDITLGISEEDILVRVTENAERFAALEEKNEKKLFDSTPDLYTDNFMRALGTLRSAYMISSTEASELLVKVKCGMNCGALSISTKEELDELFVRIMPYTLCETINKEISDNRERDIYRAEYLRNFFE